LGYGFHLGIAWTILFNLLVAIQETCTEDDGGVMIEGSVFVEPPIKYQGPIDSMDRAAQHWRERIAQKNEDCQVEGTDGAGGGAAGTTRPYSNRVCSYAWTADAGVRRFTKSFDLGQITAALKPALTQQSGWKVHYSGPWHTPGFGTETLNATFSLAVHNATVDVAFLTVYSMAGSGSVYAGSKLALTAQVKRSQLNTLEVASYEISGYDNHAIYTKTLVPHKFRLPGGGAKVGDTVLLQAQLVSGKSFMITGMAFCQ
jgi:hypothetical protein